MIDDALLWFDTIEESFYKTCRWFDICGRNPSKFTFAADTVELSGFETTPTNVRPSPNLMKAISDFPVPTNITDIRSWFGLVNQVSYAFSMVDKMAPFRELLKHKSPFHWDDKLNELFTDSKLKILRRDRAKVYVFSTNQSQHVLPPIGRKLASDFGCSKNIVIAPDEHCFVVIQDGGLY